MRYRALIEYDGTAFFGWQRQLSQPSVQHIIEQALRSILSSNIQVFGASRTDAGVHALGQVAHFDAVTSLSSSRLLLGLNHYLRNTGVSILELSTTGDDFHARFSAKCKHYVYRLVNRKTPLALDKQRAFCVPQEIDFIAMKAAGQCLLGRHDFSSFSSEVTTMPCRTLDHFKIICQNDSVYFLFGARSFLRHQIRIMVGTLIQIALKKKRQSIKDILEGRNRCLAGVTAPAHGLYLAKIDYG